MQLNVAVDFATVWDWNSRISQQYYILNSEIRRTSVIYRVHITFSCTSRAQYTRGTRRNGELWGAGTRRYFGRSARARTVYLNKLRPEKYEQHSGCSPFTSPSAPRYNAVLTRQHRGWSWKSGEERNIVSTGLRAKTSHYGVNFKADPIKKFLPRAIPFASRGENAEREHSLAINLFFNSRRALRLLSSLVNALAAGVAHVRRTDFSPGRPTVSHTCVCVCVTRYVKYLIRARLILTFYARARAQVRSYTVSSVG